MTLPTWLSSISSSSAVSGALVSKPTMRSWPSRWSSVKDPYASLTHVAPGACVVAAVVAGPASAPVSVAVSVAFADAGGEEPVSGAPVPPHAARARAVVEASTAYRKAVTGPDANGRGRPCEIRP